MFVGQELLGIDTLTNRVGSGKVLKIKKTPNRGIYSLTAISGETLQCSPGHLLVPDLAASSKRVGEYKIGDSLLIYNAQAGKAIKSEIAAMEFFDIREPVFTFKSETPNSTYLSARIISNG